MNITFEVAGANKELLTQELHAALGALFQAITFRNDACILGVVDDAPASIDDTINAVLAAHDPDVLTAKQEAIAVAETAPTRVKAIPGWALWSEDQAVDWIAANVTDLASAKVALTAMARIIVALRDAQWPTLSID